MDPAVILGAIIVLPIVVLTLLRINAVLVFLTLCLGSVLVQFISKDTQSLIGFVRTQSTQNVNVDNPTMKLVLLLLPTALTALFMIGTIKGKFRMILNVIPAAGVGVLLALLGVPLLPAGISHSVMTSPLGQDGQKFQNIIVGVTAVASLITLWLERPKSGHSSHKKSKH